MVKAIFLDIDGTLFSHKTMSIPNSSKIAIKSVREKGIKVFLASGRSLQELEEIDYEDLEFDGYITNNGMICYDAKKNIIYDNPINHNDIQAILPLFLDDELSMLFVNKDKMYHNFINEKTIKAQRSANLPCAPICAYKGEKIYQIVIYCDIDEANKMLDRMPHSKMTKWHEYAFDIISKEGSKYIGILNTLKYFDLEDACFMAVGDAINDMEMVLKAPIGIAMGNACMELKEKASYTTDHIDQDGLYKAFKHFGLI